MTNRTALSDTVDNWWRSSAMGREAELEQLLHERDAQVSQLSAQLEISGLRWLA
jgi:hypothetical protein